MKHWSVSVCSEGEQILCIETKMISGVELTEEHEELIRECARHLLAFVGERKRREYELATD